MTMAVDQSGEALWNEVGVRTPPETEKDQDVTLSSQRNLTKGSDAKKKTPENDRRR